MNALRVGSPLFIHRGSRRQFSLCQRIKDRTKSLDLRRNMSRPKKKQKLMTGQQTLCFTQTRKKTSENDASLPTVIDDTGETSDSEGREKGPGDQVLEDVRYQSESKSVPDKNTKQMTQTQSVRGIFLLRIEYLPHSGTG